MAPRGRSPGLVASKGNQIRVQMGCTVKTLQCCLLLVPLPHRCRQKTHFDGCYIQASLAAGLYHVEMLRWMAIATRGDEIFTTLGGITSPDSYVTHWKHSISGTFDLWTLDDVPKPHMAVLSCSPPPPEMAIAENLASGNDTFSVYRCDDVQTGIGSS